jgi:hypothetical protein
MLEVDLADQPLVRVKVQAKWRNLSLGPINHTNKIARRLVHHNIADTKVLVE